MRQSFNHQQQKKLFLKKFSTCDALVPTQTNKKEIRRVDTPSEFSIASVTHLFNFTGSTSFASQHFRRRPKTKKKKTKRNKKTSKTYYCMYPFSCHSTFGFPLADTFFLVLFSACELYFDLPLVSTHLRKSTQYKVHRRFCGAEQPIVTPRKAYRITPIRYTCAD